MALALPLISSWLIILNQLRTKGLIMVCPPYACAIRHFVFPDLEMSHNHGICSDYCSCSKFSQQPDLQFQSFSMEDLQLITRWCYLVLCIGKALLLLLKSVQAVKINPVIFPQQHNPFQPSKLRLYLDTCGFCNTAASSLPLQGVVSWSQIVCGNGPQSQLC